MSIILKKVKSQNFKKFPKIAKEKKSSNFNKTNMLEDIQIWVGNLSKETTEEDLRRNFIKFGEILELRLKTCTALIVI